MLRLCYFPPNGAFAFVLGDDIATAKPFRLHHDEPMFFERRGDAVAAAKRGGFIVKRNGLTVPRPVAP